jgi:hypothetical protein
MGQTGAIISGSFALQCVQGAVKMYDKTSDIDIYVTTAKEPELASFLTLNGYDIMEEGASAVGGTSGYALNPICGTDVELVYHYTNDQVNTRSIQVITMRESHKPIQASRMYDFTICQVSLQVISAAYASEKEMTVPDDELIGGFVPHCRSNIAGKQKLL